jgi:hypothetical protein
MRADLMLMRSHSPVDTRLLYPAHAVERPLPENYLLSDADIFHPEDFADTVSEVHCATIPHATIVNLTILRNLAVLGDYCRHTPLRTVDVLKSYVKTLVYPKRHIPRAFAAISQWGENYFHWLTELYPSIAAASRLLDGSPILIPEHYLEVPFIVEGLELIDVAAIPYTPREILKVEELSALNQQKIGYNIPFLSDLRNELELKISPPSHATTRLYLSRRKAANKKIVNERELTEVLSRFGFDVVCMEDLTFAEQIELMQGTRLLVSGHGAGLANIIFMPRGAALYELRAHNNDYNCFFSLARTFGLQYYYRRCASDGGNFKWSNISVDPQALQRDLETILPELDEHRPVRL